MKSQANQEDFETPGILTGGIFPLTLGKTFLHIRIFLFQTLYNCHTFAIENRSITIKR